MQSRGFMSIGSRLTEERKRSGLTQADFAEKVGVSRNTQINYEADKREPTSAYLQAVKAVDIDVDYVLYGMPEGLIECPFRLTAFGAENSVISWQVCRNHASGVELRFSPSSMAQKEWYSFCETCKYNPIDSKPLSMLNNDIDGALLTLIIEHIEQYLSDTSLKVSPIKKSFAIVMLYRSFRGGNTVDKKIIEDTIKLAST